MMDLEEGMRIERGSAISCGKLPSRVVKSERARASESGGGRERESERVELEVARQVVEIHKPAA